MAAIKIVRRKNKQRKDGTAPLALRISKDYKTNYSFLGQYVLEKDWDEQQGKVKKTHTLGRTENQNCHKSKIRVIANNRTKRRIHKTKKQQNNI